MEFTDLLNDAGIALGEVAICLHKPSDPVERRALTVAAEERPDLFEAYQSNHSSQQEVTVRKRPYFASFLVTAPGEFTFLGLFERRERGHQMAKDFLADPIFSEMLEVTEGHKSSVEDLARKLGTRMRFELVPVHALMALAKRLVVTAPGGRTYMRLAEKTPLTVLEIKRVAKVVPPMPAWDALTLTRDELVALPRDWALRLAEWRGIYLISDEADGARYVGAAYGAENLLGRWRAHVAGEVGVTAELRNRATAGFRFSILELLAPTAAIEEVTSREQSWITRLYTRQFGLNA